MDGVGMGGSILRQSASTDVLVRPSLASVSVRVAGGGASFELRTL